MAKKRKVSSKASNIKKLYSLFTNSPPRKIKRMVIKVDRLPSQLRNTNKEEVLKEYERQKKIALLMEEQKQKQLSISTQAMMRKLIKVQNKSRADDMKRQRIRREQEIISRSTSILSTPYIFKGTFVNPTENVEGNPLNAENVFKETPNNPHILSTNRPNILQTSEVGNTLKF